MSLNSPRADVEALYAILSSDALTSELLLHAERLAQLERKLCAPHCCLSQRKAARGEPYPRADS
jgi:hypothetical protein